MLGPPLPVLFHRIRTGEEVDAGRRENRVSQGAVGGAFVFGDERRDRHRVAELRERDRDHPPRPLGSRVVTTAQRVAGLIAADSEQRLAGRVGFVDVRTRNRHRSQPIVGNQVRRARIARFAESRESRAPDRGILGACGLDDRLNRGGRRDLAERRKRGALDGNASTLHGGRDRFHRRRVAPASEGDERGKHGVFGGSDSWEASRAMSDGSVESPSDVAAAARTQARGSLRNSQSELGAESAECGLEERTRIRTDDRFEE